MKKITIISLMIVMVSIVFLVTLFTIKKTTLTTEKGYHKSEFISEGFYLKAKGRPQFTIKVSFKDEKDVVFLYGKREEKIHQVYWLSESNERPQKHIEENILYSQ